MILLTSKPQRERALKLINWIDLYLPPGKTRPLSRTELYDRFGNTSRSPGKELKELLLTVADPYYNMNTGKCITYRQNRDGVRWVKQQLGIENLIPKLPPEKLQQLESGNIEYELKSDRLWCDFQFIPKTIRDPIMKSSGFNWDYDIEAAAPTLLYQHSQRIYRELWLAEESDSKQDKSHQWRAPLIESYIKDRSLIRQQLSKECEIPENEIKTVINALFQGGVLSCYKDNKIFNDLGGDSRKIKALQTNKFICEIKQEIKQMWIIIKQTMPVRYRINKKGNSVRLPVSGKEKSAVYRSIEMEVGDVVRRYLKKTKNDPLWIHDGWLCKKRIYSNELVMEVKRKTGYLIKLDERVIEK